MRAAVGEQIVVHHGQASQYDDTAVILEVRGLDGEPPYVVQWSGARRASLYFPGPDTHVSGTHVSSPAGAAPRPAPTGEVC